MSSAEATFALVKEMHDSTVELAKSRETAEKLIRALEALPKPLNEIVLSLNFQRSNTIPTQTEPLKPRDTTPTPRQLNWRPFKTGTPGGWIESDENLPLRDTLVAAKSKGQVSLILEGYTYRLSGDGDRWIQRFPARPGR